MSDQEDQREADQLPGVPSPEKTPVLVGHDETLARLQHQLQLDRLPGGILLSGPRGIGKATLAFALAREILTTSGDEESVRVTEQVSAGVHPNLFVLRRKLRPDQKAFYTVIRVEEVRELIARMHQTRGRAAHRVCIIDAIDECNVSSANALLKTLEEPPADTHFILISHRPGQLLPTIRSRCQAHPMRPLADAQVRQIVEPLAGEHVPDVGTAVELAGGRPRRALEALAVTDSAVLKSLQSWLQSPDRAADSAAIKLAEGLSGAQKQVEAGFAREILLDWIATEARDAGATDPIRLASASALWENANALFSDAEIYNLDPRQTLMAIFDAIRKHDRLVSERISA